MMTPKDKLREARAMKIVRLSGLALALISLGAMACASTGILHENADHPLRDESATSAALDAKRFRKLMVLPPSGTDRGQWDAVIAVFERQFLRAQVTVISGAVTGRVVLEQSGGDKKDEGAASLSDVERALVMAKRSGADAVLQVGTYAWTAGDVSARFFAYSDAQHRFVELTKKEFDDSKSPDKIFFDGPQLTFVGRLIDVEDGQVVASFQTFCNALWNLPADYEETIVLGKRVLVSATKSEPAHLAALQKSENWNISNRNRWLPDAESKCTERVIGTIVASVSRAR